MATRTRSATAARARRVRAIAATTTWTEVEAGEVLSALRESGLTKGEFGRRYGISGWRLWSWGKRVKAAPPAPAMLRVHVRDSEPRPERGAAGPVEVVLRSGRVVRVSSGFDAGDLVGVVAALEGAC